MMVCRRLMMICLTAVLVPFADQAVADACKSECGRVASVTTETREGKASGAGALAGGVVGGLLGNQVGGGNTRTLATIGGAAGGAYVGNQMEKKSKTETVHVVTVEMDGGNARKFTFRQKPQFLTGDRTQVRNGKLERYSGP